MADNRVDLTASSSGLLKSIYFKTVSQTTNLPIDAVLTAYRFNLVVYYASSDTAVTSVLNKSLTPTNNKIDILLSSAEITTIQNAVSNNQILYKLKVSDFSEGKIITESERDVLYGSIFISRI